MSTNYYHDNLRDSLIAELKKIDPQGAETAGKIVPQWGSLSDERRREWLRLLVRSVRTSRDNELHLQRKRAATMLSIGMNGLEAIFSLSEKDAFEKAKEVLSGMALAERSIGILNEVQLDTKASQALDQLPAEQKSQAEAELKAFLTAHHRLSEHFKDEYVAGMSLLPLLVARAGGKKATEEDRAQWKTAFAQLEKLNEG